MNYIFRSFGYLKDYKKNVLLNLVVTVIVSFLEIFSLLSIVPLLNILFTKGADIKDVEKPESFQLFPIDNAIKNAELQFEYFKYYISETYSKPTLLIWICVSIFCIFLLKNIFVFLDQVLERNIKYNVERDERRKFFENILNLPIFYFNNQKRGDILTRYSKDIVNLQQSALGGYKMLIKQPILVIFYIFSMFAISTKLTLFVFILIPVLGFLISRISKSLKKKAHYAKGTEAILLNYIDETMFGSKIIKAFSAENYLKEKFEESNQTLNKIIKSIERRQAASSPISETLGIGIVMLVLWYGGSLILSDNSKLTPEYFIAFILLFARLIEPIKSFSSLYSTLVVGMVSADRLNEFYSLESEFNPYLSDSPIPFQNKIEFQNIVFQYPESNKSVLKNISFSIPKGTTTALVGQSGAGKSTIADIVPRFFDVTDGDILIDQKSVKTYSKKSLRQLISYVSQEAILFNDTVANNIAFGLRNKTKEQIIEAAKIANAHEFIGQLEDGYDTIVGERGSKLSGGQRQRITIARAILKNAPILILDEATSALDSESEKLVQDAIDKLLKDRTALVIAHRLSTIKNAHQICVMQDGKIVEQGTHQELLSSGGYYKTLTEMQSL